MWLRWVLLASTLLGWSSTINSLTLGLRLLCLAILGLLLLLLRRLCWLLLCCCCLWLCFDNLAGL
jgi:hypothetical protein